MCDHAQKIANLYKNDIYDLGILMLCISTLKDEDEMQKMKTKNNLKEFKNE